MLQTRVFRAAQGYVPMIKFKGHHGAPAAVDHSAQPHPASPSPTLPDSFAAYRQKSQSHGPLGGSRPSASSSSSNSAQLSSLVQSGVQHFSAGGTSILAYGHIGGKSGNELGSVAAPKGVAFDRSELPERFGRMKWSSEDMEAVESGGASMW